MKSIKVKHFKAFKDELEIKIEEKSLLVYGENGAGKSSIYNALRVIFFQDKLSEEIEEANTPEEQEQLNNDYWEKYNNKNSDLPFEILINDENHKDFNTNEYQVFMVSSKEIQINDYINLNTFLEDLFIGIDDISTFCEDSYKFIEEEINDNLEKFHENIKITIDREQDYAIILKDEIRNLESKRDLDKYFNEAKLNLVALLLFFNAVRYSQQDDKKKILILDDFITSLDISNRTFLMNYIFDEFADFQIVMLTHNINFYNLTSYIIKDIKNLNKDEKNPRWKFGNIYELNAQNLLYLKDTTNSIKEINERYKADKDVEKTGNQLRQKFEVLSYEFSKLLMIGAVEEHKIILSRIESSKNIYYKEGKNIYDLIDEIEESLREPDQEYVDRKIKSKINSYRVDNDNFKDFKTILSGLKLYKKVTLHPLSHGYIGETSYTNKEIKNAILLLEKFEKQIKNIIGSDVSGI